MHKWTIGSLLIGLIFFSAILSPVAVHAAETDQPAIFMKKADGEDGYFTIEGKPGSKQQVTVNLQNTSDGLPASAVLYVDDAITAQGGGMGISAPEQAARKNVGAWFDQPEQRVALQPKVNKNVTLSFTIPVDAGIGQHVGNIILYKFMPSSSDADANENKATITINKAYSQSIAVLVNIPGPRKSDLVLKTINPNWNGPDLFLNLLIANEGNTIEKSQGSIKLVSKDGKREYEIQGTMDSIYPGTTGTFSFIAPDSIKETGDYSAMIDWEYTRASDGQTVKITDSSADAKLHQTFDFSIAPKDVKNAQVKELATLNKDKPISPDIIVLNPNDLKRYGGMLAAVLLLIILSVIAVVKRNNKRRKQMERSDQTVIQTSVTGDHKQEINNEPIINEQDQTGVIGLSRVKSRGKRNLGK
jgi:hypothetical protein